MQKALDDLRIESLEKLVEAQRKLIDEQQKEIKGLQKLTTQFCDLIGIEAPKWEG